MDKILHFIIFGIMGWFLCRGMYLSKNHWVKKNYFLIALGIGIIFAFSDEWHQSFVEGRYSSFADWIADTAGIIIFCLLYQKIKTTDRGV
ncbi:MAG: VanZ family protein [Candidatus Aminicenantes bacterium]|nr:VanZ family protein [Candidatus Aminicenantes bacterium]